MKIQMKNLILGFKRPNFDAKLIELWAFQKFQVLAFDRESPSLVKKEEREEAKSIRFSAKSKHFWPFLQESAVWPMAGQNPCPVHGFLMPQGWQQ